MQMCEFIAADNDSPMKEQNESEILMNGVVESVLTDVRDHFM